MENLRNFLFKDVISHTKTQTQILFRIWLEPLSITVSKDTTSSTKEHEILTAETILGIHCTSRDLRAFFSHLPQPTDKRRQSPSGRVYTYKEGF